MKGAIGSDCANLRGAPRTKLGDLEEPATGASQVPALSQKVARSADKEGVLMSRSIDALGAYL